MMICSTRWCAAVLGVVLTTAGCSTVTYQAAPAASPSPATGAMQRQSLPSGDGAFPFTLDELVQGFALVEDRSTATEHAREALSALNPDSDWAMSGQTLLLLYVGSESARRKIDSLRAGGVLEDAPGAPSWDSRVQTLREELERRRQSPPGA